MFRSDEVWSLESGRKNFADLTGPVPAWLEQRPSRWMPEYIRIELDAFGIPVLPAQQVPAWWNGWTCGSGSSRWIA
jgi:hypothetical protein